MNQMSKLYIPRKKNTQKQESLNSKIADIFSTAMKKKSAKKPQRCLGLYFTFGYITFRLLLVFDLIVHLGKNEKG